MSQQTANSAKIGVATAVIIGLNAMIGSGIFSAPAALASYVGPAGILTYLFVTVAVWFMAISFARLAELFPEEGSFYTYASKWGGHTVGIIAAGAYLVGLMIAMGLLSRMAGAYLHVTFPSIDAYYLGFATLAALVVLNLFGVALSELGQYVLIVCTTFPLFATTIMCLMKANVANLTPFAPHGIGNVFKATKMVIFGFFGFECAASLFNIVKNPARNVPRALAYSIILIGTLYILFVGSIIVSTPLSYFTDPLLPISEVLRRIFPTNTWLIGLIHLSILSAIIGTIHSMIWSSSELLLAFVNKLKYKNAVQFSPTENQRRIAVLGIGTAIFITFTTLKNIDLFFSITATCIVSAFILSMITLLTLKEEWRSGRNIKTILGMTTACLILYYALEGLAGEITKAI